MSRMSLRRLKQYEIMKHLQMTEYEFNNIHQTIRTMCRAVLYDKNKNIITEYRPICSVYVMNSLIKK